MGKRKQHEPPRAEDHPREEDRGAQREGSAWVDHEHVTPTSQLHAERLLQEVGSPELAKLAIDQAKAGGETTVADDSQLAQRLGYVSFLELFESSKPIPTADGSQWCIAPRSSGTWVAWERQSRFVSRDFESLEAATDFVHAQSGAGAPAKNSPVKET